MTSHMIGKVFCVYSSLKNCFISVLKTLFLHEKNSRSVSFISFPYDQILGRREMSHPSFKTSADFPIHLALLSVLSGLLTTPYFLFSVPLHLGSEIWNILWLEGLSVDCKTFRFMVHLIWREQKAWANRDAWSPSFWSIF